MQLKYVGFSYPDQPLLHGSRRTMFLYFAAGLLALSAVTIGTGGGLAFLASTWCVGGIALTLIELVRATMTKAAVLVWLLCLPVAFMGWALGRSWELLILVLPLSVGVAFMSMILITGLLQIMAMVTAGCCAVVMSLVTWAAYGPDAAAAALSVELAAEGSPSGTWTVNEVPNLGRSSLVHSTHADPQCITILVSWLEKALTGGAPHQPPIRRLGPA